MTTSKPAPPKPAPPRPRGDGPRRAAQPGPATESDAAASVEAAEPVALPSPEGLVRGLVLPLAQPRPLAREATRVGREALRILRGTADITPSPKDKRFADPTWSGNPAYRRLMQGYLALSASAGRLVEEYEAGGADWRRVEQARFVMDVLHAVGLYRAVLEALAIQAKDQSPPEFGSNVHSIMRP